ncbi:translation initiation factor IF-2 [Candidatus Beckwithbacteria bacterium CG22_combo_CG10-13_8_21_14_all_01_47_9]|uniref:Translation initiation factor IF-2 n=5 Tax=Candidatus Beckwithiibacteriota TaxID=1752726 RepID=A0A2H0E247_9BACT|nr:MAG: translation initiation factor IF-2 [Candidatus Beckwithbacteria bacterium CG23_combo_of_CG06-09_8_20_14_all_47_9]PIP88321.1 MAG: translation initiation factor IF-2 [Candidatus Beckwithbacteria bacterium CG22_combo_CG10-13_8_21_14_all_01_47_9]PJA22855.1 MAG: translation initiation factor IF-2 [Candidatus Beckwithbacteria bacterium CG_4_10_14_0_2_um_filter_47_25]PJC66363.1 MAG: translation initiation factor IF-2 [Candidatus Beckwithbacteria bacterium CG_4_9_14_0_2_um_filter_47_11]
MMLRPPIITVMGHIDHGKTTLLDALRQTSVAAKESGGITQHIGAYQVDHQGKKLTFIDTPGHAAFSKMRSRGAAVTDLVILVVDAVESVKPQTKECLEHIKAAGVPFLVAINKMDLPNAVPEIVKKDLADSGVMVEGYGGDIVCVPISAKTKKGLPELLEMVLLMAEMQKLTGDPQAPLNAVVIESTLDPKRGSTATVIVKAGTLRVGQDIYTPETSGRVRQLLDWRHQPLRQAQPGDPALILGLKQVPVVGSVVSDQPVLQKSIEKQAKTVSADKKLKLLIKADVTGTLEAIVGNLGGEVELVGQGVGTIYESDVLLAQSTGARIIAFRVKVSSQAEFLAEKEAVLIKSYQLIHELLDDIQQQILKLLEPTIDEQVLGEASVLQAFTVKNGQIAGCQVNSGKLTVGDQVNLMRGEQLIGSSRIKSIYQGKEKVDKAKRGEQYGIGLTNNLEFQTKDKLVAYKTL